MCGLRSESRREVSGKNRAVGREIWQGPSQPPRRAYARVGGIGARGGQAPVCQPDITVLVNSGLVKIIYGIIGL